MVSGIPTASGYEERIQFSEIEVVDRGANEQGLLANMPEGHAIYGWDVNVAAVRVSSTRRTVRRHQHAVCSRTKQKYELYSDKHRNSLFVSVERASLISTLRRDMAISSNFTNNCRSSYRASHCPFFPERTSRQRRRVSLATVQQMMTVVRFRRRPQWEREPLPKSAERLETWFREAFLSTADHPLDHLAGLRWVKGPSRLSRLRRKTKARILCFTERNSGFPSVRSSVQSSSRSG